MSTLFFVPQKKLNFRVIFQAINESSFQKRLSLNWKQNEINISRISAMKLSPFTFGYYLAPEHQNEIGCNLSSSFDFEIEYIKNRSMYKNAWNRIGSKITSLPSWIIRLFIHRTVQRVDTIWFFRFVYCLLYLNRFTETNIQFFCLHWILHTGKFDISITCWWKQIYLLYRNQYHFCSEEDY